MDALTIVVYISGYIFLVFLSVSMACGLYFLAELCEEYTSLTKKILTYTNYFVAGACVFLMLFDHLPFFYMLLAGCAPVLYHFLLKDFPFIKHSSPHFLGAAALFILNNVIWIYYFHAERYTLVFASGHMFTCVWLMPIGFLISSSVNDNILPGAGVMPVRGGSSSEEGAPQMGGGGGKSSKNIVLQLAGWMKEKRQQWLPQPQRERSHYMDKAL
mmetsp:Transcript_44337/g.115239  ORF Transcript_44337/g.115239 Transcript_44337/m.115239 type:complete len:215 (-) Transcript_44337:223-867(-)